MKDYLKGVLTGIAIGFLWCIKMTVNKDIIVTCRRVEEEDNAQSNRG